MTYAIFSFADPNWRPFPAEKLDALGVTPNQLWANTSSNAGALVVKKSSRYPEFALSEAGLNYLNAAEQAGKISGYVVLATWTGGKLTVVKSNLWRTLLPRSTAFHHVTGLLVCIGGSTPMVRQMQCAHYVMRRCRID